MKWSLFKTAAKPSVSQKPVQKPAQTPFHAVEIVSLGACCQAARQAREIRFLSKDVPPSLPLAACDFPGACRCRYRHHEDRRSFQRRASDQVWGSASPVSGDRERRRTGGRRATDRRGASL